MQLADLVQELRSAGVSAITLKFDGVTTLVHVPGVAPSATELPLSDTPAWASPDKRPTPEEDRFAATGITPLDAAAAMMEAAAERAAARKEQEMPGPESQHDASHKEKG